MCASVHLNIIAVKNKLKFNDRILSLKTLGCKVCQEIPNSPIMTNQNGNICSNCYNPSNHSDAARNLTLEEILTQVESPCPFTSNGCNQIVKYKQLLGHKKTCMYRNFPCAMNTYNNCSWSGHLNNISKHFEEQHSNSILKLEGVNDYFVLHTNVSESDKFVSLLLMNNEVFLLKTVCDLELKKLFYMIYNINISNEAPQFSFLIETFEKSNCISKLNGKCLNLLKFNTIDENYSIDLSIMKQILQNASDTISVKLWIKHKMKELDKKLLANFECPVCKNYMKQQIHQCSAGHNLCKQCRSGVNICPVCRGAFCNTRNYAMETMSKDIMYPCNFRDLGCKIILTGEEIVGHETECTFQFYDCPFKKKRDCNWKSTLNALNSHLVQNHNNETKCVDNVEVTVDLSLISLYNGIKMFTINAFNEIFCIYYKPNGSVNDNWALQIMELSGNSKKYQYEVSLINLENGYRKTVHADICHKFNENDVKYLTFDCISNLSFVFNNKLTYYIKIFAL